jgi:hypothetical protein
LLTHCHRKWDVALAKGWNCSLVDRSYSSGYQEMKTAPQDKSLLSKETMIVGVVVVVLWLSTPFLASWLSEEPGRLGDSFGSINSLFTGLAFVALIATLKLQQQELHENTAQLKEQAQALDSQVKVMSLSAQLAALPVLLDHERERLRISESGGGAMYQEITRKIHDSNQLRQRIKEIEKILHDGRVRLPQIEKELKEISKRNPGNSITAGDLKSSESLHNEKRNIQEQARLGNGLPFFKRILFYMEEIDDTYAKLSLVGKESGPPADGDL